MKPIAAIDVAPRTTPSNYPEPFASRMAGRVKRQLGDMFGLKNFGVNLTTLKPGAVSALHHRHSLQDEFIYVVSGNPTVFLDNTRHVLAPGMVVGYAAGGAAHHLKNETDEDVTYLEIGDRTAGDEGTYPDDDLVAERKDGRWVFFHKDGTPY